MAQTRPEPMNASPHHPKLKVNLRLADPICLAGGHVAGKMEVECKADKGLGISVMMVELFAIEELTSRDHSATSTFMHTRRMFQGQGLPPSNAVLPHPLPGEPQLPSGHYQARRGQTSFLFRFPLPESAPSSIDFGKGLARLRYEVRATVGVAWKGELRLVTDKKEVNVAESFSEDMAADEPEAVVVGENGKIWAQARLVGAVAIAGQSACVELQVKNHSSKKNTGLSLAMSRHLHLPAHQKSPLQISDTLTSVNFRGLEYIINPGVEGVANLVFDVPRAAKSVKGGLREDGAGVEARTSEALFEVRCVLAVRITMGIGSKDLNIELPVTVVHPNAMPYPPEPMAYPGSPIPPPMSPMPYPGSPPPMSPMPYDYRAQSPYMPPMSPMPVAAAYPYPHPSAAYPYVDHGRVWLPPPSHTPMPYQYFAPPAPAPMARPLSAEPAPSALPAGLPAFSSGPALFAALAGVPESVEGEEGKGERASRFTHHLRTSSRTRSVSPMSHRFPAPLQPQPSGNGALAVPIGGASQSPENLTTNGLSASPAGSQGEIHSPRPLLSPKNSFTLDPEMRATLSKSERVEALEKMAEVVAKETRDLSGDIPNDADLGLANGQKTLPGPPVPTGKERVLSAMAATRPRADTLFAAHSSAPPPPPLSTSAPHAHADTPRTPTLTAFSPRKFSGVASRGGGESGLDALERKLLAEVGTRKPPQERKPDVREVMGVGPIEIPRGREGGPQTPLNDSAISSLTLSNKSIEEARGGKTVYAGEFAEARTEGGRRGRRGAARDEGSADGSGGEADLRRETTIKDKSERKSGRKKEKVGKEVEAFQLRHAAKGRVAAWLESVSPSASAFPPTPDPLLSEEDPSTSKPTPRASPPRSIGTPEQPTSPPPPKDKDVSAAPNPRSSGFMPIPDKLKARAAAPVVSRWPGFAADQPAKYDVRSQRGGRGGKVTSVASLWQNQTSQAPPTPPEIKPKPKPKLPAPNAIKLPTAGKSFAAATRGAVSPGKPPPPKPAPKPAALNGKPTPVAATSQPAPARRPEPTRTKGLQVPAKTPASTATSSPVSSDTNVADLSINRARLIKSTSVPAMLSSSHATPMLSSTASLARPSPAAQNKTKAQIKLPPTIAESSSEGKLAAKPLPAESLAFGKARLRDLIKKYQGA